MLIFSPNERQNLTIITKKGEKILLSAGGFLGKIYFLTGVILKFYQKSNFSPKNKLFSIFLGEYLCENVKIITSE